MVDKVMHGDCQYCGKGRWEDILQHEKECKKKLNTTKKYKIIGNDQLDAERYRWLRRTADHDCAYGSLEDKAWYALLNESSEVLDAAIDAAIIEEKSK